MTGRIKEGSRLKGKSVQLITGKGTCAGGGNQSTSSVGELTIKGNQKETKGRLLTEGR